MVFLSFAGECVNKYGKNTATKTWIDPAKTTSKRVVQRTAKATEDLIGNKIAENTTLEYKPNEKETKKLGEIDIPPEKRQQIIDDLRLFWKMWYYCIKMEFQKIENFLDTNFDTEDLPKFLAKKRIEVYDQSKQNYNPKKEITIKTSMIRTDLWDYSDAYIIVNGTIITVTNPDNAKRICK